MTEEQAPPPPLRDPWKGLRGVMVAILVLETIVVLLALLVVVKSSGSGTETGLVLGLAVALLLACGVQGRRWGLGLALALQLVMIGCFFVVPALGVLGVVFALVWVYLLRLRREVARRMAAGQLPGQQRQD